MSAPADAIAPSPIAPEQALVVSMRGGARLCVPPFLNQITPYVLLEQEDWFEDEIRFVRAWLKPGMRAVDVGANYGVYTLAAALRVGAAGRIWAIEPTPQCAAFLRRSLEMNGCAQARVLETAVSERRGRLRLALKPLSEINAVVEDTDAGPGVEVQASTLDELASECGWTGVDFLKLDIEGHEAKAIRGGARFLAENSPLLMLEVQASGALDYQGVELLAGMGYATYRLLPGPLLLVPFQPGEAWDPYGLNLFACKPERARQLADEGLLALRRSAHGAAPDPGAWTRYAAAAPYAAGLASRWPGKPGLFSAQPTRQYFSALAAFAQSQDPGQEAARRWALLESALHGVERALAARDSAARQLSRARLAWELGRRDAAVSSLKAVATLPKEAAPDLYAEPFLSPSPRFDSLAWSPDPAAWLRCAALEQLEKLRQFSSIFVTDGTAQAILDELAGLAQRSPEMERRRQLVRMAAGRQAAPEPSPALCVRSEDNLNPEFWCSPSR